MSWRNEATARDLVPPNLGAMVRDGRRRLGLTQASFAKGAGIGLKTLQRLEWSGRASPATIARVEHAFGLAVGTLVPGWDVRVIGLGPKMRALRLKRGLTPRDIQEEFGIGPSMLSRLERNLGPDADSRWHEILNPYLAWGFGFNSIGALKKVLGEDD